MLWFSSGTIRERPRGVLLFPSFFSLWRGIVTHPHVSRFTPRTTNSDQRRLNTHWTVLRPFSGVECPRLRTSFASFPVYSSGLFGESLRDRGIIDIWGLFFFFFDKMIYIFSFQLFNYLLYDCFALLDRMIQALIFRFYLIVEASFWINFYISDRFKDWFLHSSIQNFDHLCEY